MNKKKLKSIYLNMLEKYLKINYIELKDKGNRVCIDVRTEEEFILMNFFDNNIPVITKEYHYEILKYKILAPVLIIISIMEKKEYIDLELMRLSSNKTKPLLFACSNGLLRSPALYFYAKFKGIDAVVLKGGLKHRFSKDIQSKYFNNIKGCTITNQVVINNEYEEEYTI